MNGSTILRFVGTTIFTAFAGLSLAACDGNSTTTSTSGGGGSGGSGGNGGNSASNGETYAKAYCDRVFDCCNTADLVEKFGATSGVVDYAGCRILYRSIWDGGIAPVVAEGEKAGRVTFHQANFDSCIQSFGELSCADFNKVPALCKDMFTPKVALGQPCFSSLECVDGTCDIPQGASAGSCIAKPTPASTGEACANSDGCADGLYCKAMICQPVEADGVACTNNDQCLSGTCIGKDQGTGKCGKICEGGGPGSGPTDPALEPIGAELAITECDKYFECCSGDEFDTVLFPGMRTKAQCLTLLSTFGGIAIVQTHNDTVQNKVSVDAAKVQSCLDNFASLTCQDFAKSSSFKCVDGIKGLVADGASCTDDRQCTSQFCNEPMPNQGTCAAIPGAGAPCTTKCVDGYYCSTGTCTAKKPAGSMCNATSECAEGRCYGATGMKTCTLVCDGI